MGKERGGWRDWSGGGKGRGDGWGNDGKGQGKGKEKVWDPRNARNLDLEAERTGRGRPLWCCDHDDRREDVQEKRRREPSPGWSHDMFESLAKGPSPKRQRLALTPAVVSGRRRFNETASKDAEADEVAKERAKERPERDESSDEAPKDPQESAEKELPAPSAE